MGALVRQDTTVIGGRFRSPRPLEGLEGPAASLPFLGMSLGDRQTRAFLEAGLDIVDGYATDGQVVLPEDRWRILVREDVAVTRAALDRFLAQARSGEVDVSWRASGRVGNVASEVALGELDEPWLVALAPGGEVTTARIDACTPLMVEVDERLVQFPLPAGQFEADALELPLTESLVLPCGHWVQLLWANLLALGPHLYRTLGGKNIVEMGVRLVGAVVRARTTDPARVMATYVRLGDDCRIHPTAIVESSWLSDGVEIGPHAVVRGCIIGEGASIEALSIVEGCVLASRSTVQRQAMVKYSVLGSRAAAAGDMQLGVLDRDAALKKTAALLDQAIRGAVKVSAWGRVVPAPLGLAGVGVGARTIVGADVFVAPGRTLPPDLVVVPDPRSVLRRIPSDVRPGTWAVVDGSLVCLAERSPSTTPATDSGGG
jgi:carbonic anhydrase/acetyltransferase-like protein (isoleucine patch superfamily)